MAQRTKSVVTNLEVLKKTRRAPVAGDVFALKPPDDFFLFGRVVSTEAITGSMVNCILIYIYAVRSPNKLEIPPLLRTQLLIPPLLTNKLPWSKGYFEFLENRPLEPMDCLPQHCFKRAWTTPPQYFDEKGNSLPGPVGPVGIYGLHSYRIIDDQISKALGIPLAPEG